MPTTDSPALLRAKELVAALRGSDEQDAAIIKQLQELGVQTAELRSRVQSTIDAYLQARGEASRRHLSGAEELVSLLTPPLPVYRSGLNWRSGFRLPRNKTPVVLEQYPPLEAWRRRPLDTVDLFLGPDLSANWNSLQNNYVFGGGGGEAADAGILRAHLSLGHTPVLAFPLVIDADARKFDLLAGGAFDEQHDRIAQRIAAIVGTNLIMLRPGWECNEGWPSSVQDDKLKVGIPDDETWRAHYRNGFRRVALIYKARIPNVMIFWNHLTDTRRAMKFYYPGDDCVDAITMDCYDAGWGGYVNSDAAWEKYAGGYNPSTGVFRGPKGLIEFARSVHKPTAFDEWGPMNRTYLPTDGANNAYFVGRMFKMFQELAQNEELVQECYFHAGGKNPHLIYPESPYNPLPRQAYLSCYTPPVEKP